ncbi:MAG TPA: DUF2723 domain-containing protein, partial [Gemmatimonadaceae bacterium]|nr:DUF2723 domain-containing protein [Gemmatimonadaceae bacterium]
FTDWNQSVVNEKVYTVALVGIAVISWLMIRWSDDPDGPKADRILVLVAYLSSLGYGVHMAGMLAAPAVAVAVLVRRPRTLLRWRLLLAIAGALVLGLTPFATQPIRAAYNPPIDEGEPTACRNGLHLSCTFSSGTYDAFMYNFNRGQYGKPALDQRQAPFTGQIGMWWYYFKWQWMRDPFNQNPAMQSILAAVFFVLGAFGAWVHFQRERRSFWYFGTYMFTTTLLLIYYLNFKYGATQPVTGDVAREVRDRDYFFLWSFSAWGVWAALGLVFIWESVASFFGTERTKLGKDLITLPTDQALKFGSPILLIAIIPLFTNWQWAPRSGQTDTRDFAHDLLDSVEPYGVLVTVGDNDTFPLWYAQEVEGIRRDVIDANTSLLNTDWYGRQLLRRPVYDYDEAKGPAVYRGKQWEKPKGPPLNMSLSDIDAIPEAEQLPNRMAFDAGGLHAILDPDSLEEGYLQRADILVLRMIKDAWPARPVYFSRTSGDYPSRTLGLAKYLIEQGLASKVIMPPAKPTPDTVWMPPNPFRGEGEWMDVQRSKELWLHDFTAPASLIRRGSWIDEPSKGIPYLYVITGGDLIGALRTVHDTADAQHAFATMMGVAHMIRMDGPGVIPPLNSGFWEQGMLAGPPPAVAATRGDSAHGPKSSDTRAGVVLHDTGPKKRPPARPGR